MVSTSALCEVCGSLTSWTWTISCPVSMCLSPLILLLTLAFHVFSLFLATAAVSVFVLLSVSHAPLVPELRGCAHPLDVAVDPGAKISGPQCFLLAHTLCQPQAVYACVFVGASMGRPVVCCHTATVSVMSHSLAGSRRTPPPSLFPQSHTSPVSAPSHDGNPSPTPPSPHWALKITMDQDTRRLPLLCSGTPTYHDVITGVDILFNLAHSDPATRHALFYRDSEGDICTLTSTTFHDALPLFSSNHIIRLSLAATHLTTDPLCPGHQPKHASRYLPPAHAIAGLLRDQTRNMGFVCQEHDGAVAQWRSAHQSNPCSSFALHSLRELFHDDSSGGLDVFRSCLKEPTPRLQSQNAMVLGSRGPPSPSTEPPPSQCPVPGTWPADEVLSAAKWIFVNPGLEWSPTPGAGGHKQIRIKFAIINHWNSGVVNVQGRDARLVSDKILSTRHSSVPPPSTPDSAWLPSSRRRKRNTASSDTLGFATDCRSPPATPPFTSPPQGIPNNLSRFSALSLHHLDQPDPSSSPSQPLEPRSPRRSTATQTVSPLSSGTRTRAPSPTCSPSSDKGAPVGNLLYTFFSLIPMILSGVGIIFISALSVFCCLAFVKHPLPGNLEPAVATGVGGIPTNWLTDEGLADALSAWNPLVTGPQCDHPGSDVSFGSAGLLARPLLFCSRSL